MDRADRKADPKRRRHRLWLPAASVIAAAALVGARATRAAQTAAAVPEAAISENAAALFPEIDRRAALSDLTPARNEALAAGDREVWIWVGASAEENSGYVFQRRGGVWSGINLFPTTPPTKVCHYRLALSAPPEGWETFWKGLETDGIRTLTDHGPFDPRRRTALAMRRGDGVLYLIEVRDGAAYRAYTYVLPDRQRDDADGIMAIARALVDRFSLYNLRTIVPIAAAARQRLLLAG